MNESNPDDSRTPLPSGRWFRLAVFEGPLDLLLHLIKRNELDPQDVTASVVTEQYLEYLELLDSLNLDVAGEYLVMAATLLLIKSFSLLPASGPRGRGGGRGTQTRPDRPPARISALPRGRLQAGRTAPAGTRRVRYPGREAGGARGASPDLRRLDLRPGRGAARRARASERRSCRASSTCATSRSRGASR